MRNTGDILADGVIAELFARSEIDQVNALMRTPIRNEFLEPEAFPPAVHDYLEQTDRLPARADPGLIAAGGRLFEEHGPKLMLILSLYSLPFDYLYHKDAQALPSYTNAEQSSASRHRGVAIPGRYHATGGLTSGEGSG